MQFIQNNLSLVLLAAISGAMLLWSSFGRKLTGLKEVSAQEAVLLINHNNALVLDVREDKELAAGKIPNAKHIPLGQLPGRTQELLKFKDKAIVVNCRSGMRSASACRMLAKDGFTQVYNLKGGIIAWEKDNMPMEKK